MTTNFAYDSDKVYAEESCEVCFLPLFEAPVIVTLHYAGANPLHFHRRCYEETTALLPPPATDAFSLEARRLLDAS
jgi:hypothetical protein